MWTICHELTALIHSGASKSRGRLQHVLNHEVEYFWAWLLLKLPLGQTGRISSRELLSRGHQEEAGVLHVYTLGR